ncbi:MAG: EthD domain-containing protein [Acidimicrobiales bacterium]|nr:EthD domain-containing protein [Acidimicrobiales bacterium]
MNTRRLMAHLQPTDDRQRLIDAVAALDAPGATKLVQHAAGLAHPGEHAASIEYRLDVDDEDAIATAAAALEPLRDLVDPDRSVAMVGTDVDIVAGPATPIRFAYLMRRRADFTHEQYLTRYLDGHARFGIATPGIEGYTQFHVDLGASAQAAARLGLGVSDFDSVSELHLASLDTFFAALAESGFGTEATEDEEKFVDRANSWDYVYEVLD